MLADITMVTAQRVRESIAQLDRAALAVNASLILRKRTALVEVERLTVTVLHAARPIHAHPAHAAIRTDRAQ